eukprot:TRINITY_DN1129_c0_g1_i1.p1 TRINITY_DN1129_c0_g1~~TRINITY_DN1129_c0_g1_i1.p1  ORF type:complete len:378 (-),score=61.75 TRINITY_DN1129_c0_g1_i1:204-1337(-)
MNLSSKVVVSSMRRISLDGTAVCFPLACKRKMSLGSEIPNTPFLGVKSSPTISTFARRFSEDVALSTSSLLAYNHGRSQSVPKLERRSPKEVRAKTPPPTTTTLPTPTITVTPAPTNKDPKATFQDVWMNLQIQNHGELQFPKEIIFLSSAPGAGKETNCPYILSSRKITAPPIVMSSLLNSGEIQKIKNMGGLVSDEVVLTELLSEITKEQYRNGVIIDGFPRTDSQVNFVHLMAEKYMEINEVEPNFSVVVLQVSEKESISRQLSRGLQAVEQNKQRALKGEPLIEVRPTDIDPAFAATRYKNFSDSYQSLMSLKKHYTFYSIDASGTKEEVKKNIERTMSLEETTTTTTTTTTTIQIFSTFENLDSLSGKLAWQ